MPIVMTERHPTAITRLDAAFPHAWSFSDHLLMATVVGSESHGTYVPKDDPHAVDDVDIMGIIVPPRKYVYGLSEFHHWTPEVGNIGELDIVAYSVRKAAHLLLKCNPNIVGCLFMSKDMLLHEHAMWQTWRDNRDAFLGQRIYGSFQGYAYAQLIRLGKPNTRGYMGRERKVLFQKYGYDIKNGAHCVRLLRMGLELIKTGELNVDRTDIDADELIDIKTGKWTLERIHRVANAGLAEMEAAVGTLPEYPDLERVEQLIMETTECLWGA